MIESLQKSRGQFNFFIDSRLAERIKIRAKNLVSSGGNDPTTRYYRIGEEISGKIDYTLNQKISFGTISSWDENFISLFKGKIQIPVKSSKKITYYYIVGTLNFKTGEGWFSFYERSNTV